ncbi:MAG: competence protein ComK [Bacilli bacterium]|nr:competence protein ComK [Bacilli bacterium]
MADYIINSDTLLLIPLDEDVCKIVEKEREIIIKTTVMDVINNSCLYFGCSLQGRIEGTKYLLNCSYKLPIVVDNHNDLIFFPTLSYTSSKCHWISFNNIESYTKKDKNNTLIKFNNQNTYVIPTTLSSFENQYFRSLRLHSILIKKDK